MENHSTEFETKVLEGLTEVRTKMNLLIDDNGSEGMVPNLQKKVAALERKYWIIFGGAGALSVLGHWLVDAYRAVKGH